MKIETYRYIYIYTRTDRCTYLSISGDEDIDLALSRDVGYRQMAGIRVPVRICIYVCILHVIS